MRIPLAVILATLLLGAFASPTTAAEGPARVVVVPAATLGEVREIFVKRLNKKIRDVLAFAGRVKVLKAEDRLPKHLTEKKVIKKPSKAQLQLAEADRLRLEGMDFYGKAKFKRAYRRFLHATQIYEKYFYELVDYNNLADAYARAAVAASRGGLKKHDVKFLFTNGLSLQPTLVIDRRKAPAKLLEMFDSLVAITKKAKRKEVALVAKGDAEGAIAYVDGHRVGPLPGRRGGLLSGYHYVQVRSPNHKPWGKQIRIRSKNVTVKIKLKPIKKKKVKAPPKPLTFADLGWCKNTGSFHDKKCKKLGKRMAAQTGAGWLLYSALKADRYGRLTVHAFLSRGSDAAFVALPPIQLKKNLGDLNAKMPALEEEVSKRIAKWPRKRAMRKRPSAFK